MYRIGILLCLAVSMPTGIRAQHQDREAAGFPRLEAGSRIRLVDTTGVRRIGVLLRTEGGKLVLQEAAVTYDVPLPAIETLWVRRRATREGLFIGGVAAGGLGLVMGILFNRTFCESGFFDVRDPCPGVIPLFTVTAALVGGLVGAGIGSLLHTWRRRYP